MEEKSVAIKDARTLGVPKMLLLGASRTSAHVCDVRSNNPGTDSGQQLF